MVKVPTSFRDSRHVDKTYYLGVDQRFYEPNYSHYVPSNELRQIAEDAVKHAKCSWDIITRDVWTHVIPDDDYEHSTELLRQGWKIHVSATNTNCAEVLRKVAVLAITRNIQFKFANDTETLRLMTSKRWARGGSGKFITLYPGSEAIFKSFLNDADTELLGLSGSYILSDKRYRDNRCLYYRYGGMRSTTRLDIMGRNIEILTSPNGETFDDIRYPYFELPEWLDDPFPTDDDRTEVALTLNGGRFVVQSALSYSNTGGVYLATDTENGNTVVVKEARPGVELAIDGTDAVVRLRQEASLLLHAQPSNITPKVITTFFDWENFYLVEEYFAAEDMRAIMLSKTPLLYVSPSKEDSENFYSIYIDLFIKILDAIEALHGVGVVIGDLSPTNILFDKVTREVRIIDLEGAYRPGIDTPQDIHTPGFRADSKNRNKSSDYDDDLYAVGVIMLYAMFPIGAMAFIRDDLFSSVLPTIVNDIGWDETPVIDTIRKLVGNEISAVQAKYALTGPAVIKPPSLRAKHQTKIQDIETMLEGTKAFLATSFRTENHRTLFPIDPFGQQINSLGYYFGATGVLHTLHRCGEPIPKAAMERYRNELSMINPGALAPGLLTGSAGMAWGLLELGMIDEALRFIDAANASGLAYDHHSLYYGMAGLGMANLAFYAALEEPRFWHTAKEIADRLLLEAKQGELGHYWSQSPSVLIGYGYGQSGTALFLLRFGQMSKNNRYVDLGRSALRFDLSHGVSHERGTLSFGESTDRKKTLEQYLEQGSAGIAKVAIRFGMLDEIEPLLNDIHRKYSCFAGLIYGLSGFVDVLCDAYLYSKDSKYLQMAQRPLEGLRDLYLFETDNGIAAPGENLFRISCDYATGLSGILTTLRRRLHLESDTFCLDKLDELEGQSLCVNS